MSASVGAHPVVTDGSLGDWFATAPITSPGAYPNLNTGQVARNAAQQGEFIWRDTFHDQRIIATSAITRDADLRTFKVTGDATNLYVNLNVDSAIDVSGPKAAEFQIGIDSAPGGNTVLVDDPGATAPISTSVTPNAAWEYLIQTQFKNGATSAPLVYTAPNSSSTAGTSAFFKGVGIDTAELKIPWSAIGGPPTGGGKRLRFTVATLFSDRIDAETPLANGSKVIDTMNPYQDAATDLVDGQLDYPVDIYFAASGEVFSPLVITEFLASPPAGGTEWVEIYNASSFPVSLAGYKIGDAAKPLPPPGNSEAMFQLPGNKTLSPGAFVIVANNANTFKTLYPGVDTRPGVTLYSVTNLTRYTLWGNGNALTLPKGPLPTDTTFEEQVVLLDGSDSLVDVVTYISSTLPDSAIQPGVVPIVVQGAQLPADRTYERCPAARDTNDAAFDFVAHNSRAAQTPGAICDGKTALSLTLNGQATVAVGGRIDYTLTYQNSGASATNIYITDTLPLDVSYINGSQVANPVFGASPIVFTDLGGGELQWKLPLIEVGSGTIAFSAQVANNPALIGQDRTNSATIAGPLPDTDASDNTATASTHLTALPQADVGIAKALTSALESFYNGGLAVYTLSYSNSGDLPATSTIITDTIPPGLSFVSASRRPNIQDSSKLVFNVGNVASVVDATIVMTFTVTAPEAGGTLIANTATIGTRTTPELMTDNNTATATNTTVAPPPTDLALAKTADAITVPLGGEVGYELAISNSGGRTASGIQVVDILPPGLAYKAGSSSAAAGEPLVSGDGRTLTWNLPSGFTVAPGARQAFQFRAIAATAGPGDALVNEAVVNLAGDLNTQDNAASSDAATVTGYRLCLPLVVK